MPMRLDGGPVRERLQEGTVALPISRATLRVGSAHEGERGNGGGYGEDTGAA